ncbi:phosphomannomutase [Cryptosporidium ryanae]|uniref:phosphomannomutase n=1 Tax=Cryptosporidium ryanae TaxID=515981 RepID=UPI00351A624C|nr:phosphomannomutase [Cryptosporidium ryanae]
MKNNEKLLLFDLDGTLTLARKPIMDDMVEVLKNAKNKVKIGIVSGSDYGKISEQLLGKEQICCHYVFSENGVVFHEDGKLIHSESISKHLGEDSLKKLINFCLRYIAELDIPIKRGTFIEYRTGMLNISPIGRNCSYEERLEFYELDKTKNIRQSFIDALSVEFKDMNLKYSIGGQISIDVFPNGWDKRYCLRHIEGKFDEIHFFGDKTYPGGNDYEIFSDKRVIGHSVVNPNDTIQQINRII